jgi:glucose-1-phosphate thymidylyltransferase
MDRKGIILAGGLGTRLFPITKVVSKQLMPIYNRPMIYYPLCTLMKANIREILIITTPQDNKLFSKLLGDGRHWGIEIKYEIQEFPEGIAQSLIIAEKFLNNSPTALILGDNIFYGKTFDQIILEESKNYDVSTIFTYKVKNPERYGVVDFNEKNKIISIDEKPKFPKSKYIVTGLYFYDNNASYYAKNLKPSKRGEIEITDLNNKYINEVNLKCVNLDKETHWFDSGTFESLYEVNNFIYNKSKLEKIKIACPEEISYKMGWINKEKFDFLTKENNS